MRAASFLLAFILLQGSMFAQESESERIMSQVHTSSTGEVRVGPDPDNPAECAHIVLNKQVQDAVGLSEEQVSATVKILRGLAQRRNELLSQPRDGNFSDRAKEWLNTEIEICRSAMSEILTPEQVTRVRQMAFRMEIDTLGWGRAIDSSRFSSEIGIYDNQKTRINDRIARIEAEMREKIRLAKADAEKAILAELTPAQRAKARAAIGEYVDYTAPSVASQTLQRADESYKRKQEAIRNQ